MRSEGPPVRPGAGWLALPLAGLFGACFLTPLGVLAAISLFREPEMATLGVRQYAQVVGDPFNLRTLMDTLVLGAKATAVCLVFGYPLAWATARARPRVQALLIFAVILPVLTSVVVRTFAWIVILGRQGILNRAVLALGLAREPIRLLFSEVGVVMVLAQVQMPLMVLPLLTTLQKIDPNLADASAALGAGRWRTFWRVIAPLSLPGVVAGCILVYAACATAFITQTLIGGARLLYMPYFIYQEATGAHNWPLAAAASVVFMVSVLLLVWLLNRVGRMGRAQLYA